MIRAVLTDIEGTTSSIAFVKEVLFPYARQHMLDFIRRHHDDPRVVPHLEAVRAMMGDEAGLEDIGRQLIRWIDEDRKITPLKALQGLIWEKGYREGAYRAHVYDDAVAALRRWHDRGLRLYVYSSGSVHAQKLFFGHTTAGDLTSLFSGFFDTTVGAKTDPESYRRIAREIGLPPGEILFLSDVAAELDAAREAGMATCQLVRDGIPEAEAAHRQVDSFDAIEP
ncbi:MAG TPA: acireductone synthase [Gammaproteobacteria bacterium]|nr:acireductone synthase [Gammaproteobacteria bacterium]